MRAKLEIDFELADIEDYDWDQGSDMDTLCKKMLRQYLLEGIKAEFKKDERVKAIASKLKTRFFKEIKEKLNEA